MGTLAIEGDWREALAVPHAVAGPVLAQARRLLVTGGRGWLVGEGQSRVLNIDTGYGPVVAISLDPNIARRIYTSGDTLTEEEIADGMAALRAPGRDPIDDELEALSTAYADGIAYAEQQFEAIWTANDPNATLTRAWEMARKVIALDKRIDWLKREKASRPSVEGQSASGGSESNTSGRTSAP